MKFKTYTKTYTHAHMHSKELLGVKNTYSHLLFPFTLCQNLNKSKSKNSGINIFYEEIKHNN